MLTADPHTTTTPALVDPDFYRWAEEHRGGVCTVPGRTVVHRADVFHTVHRASIDKIRELLPSKGLRPARWIDGQGLVFVAAMRLRDVTTRDVEGRIQVLPPYAQVVVGILLTTRHDVPGRPPYGHPLRGFLLQMPVTTALAASSGRRVHGYPSFVADLAFHDSPTTRRVSVTEGGHGILMLHARMHGRAHPEHAPVVLYSELDNRLLETRGRFFGQRQVMLGGDHGELLLAGLHPVAHSLRALRTDASALVTVNHIDSRLVLDAPVPVGTASARPGYLPAHEAARGRYTVDYPDTPPLDQYAVARDGHVPDGSPVG